MKSHLPLYRDNNISAYNWGLIQGKTQTYLSWKNEENPLEGLPHVWQQDLFYNNFDPYDEEELCIIKRIAKNE